MPELGPFAETTQVFLVPTFQLAPVKAVMISKDLAADSVVIQVILLKKTQNLSICVCHGLQNPSYGKNNHFCSDIPTVGDGFLEILYDHGWESPGGLLQERNHWNARTHHEDLPAEFSFPPEK